MTQETNEGQTSPLGASLCAGGANFSVYSKRAKGIELLLFDGVDGCPAQTRDLDRPPYFFIDPRARAQHQRQNRMNPFPQCDRTRNHDPRIRQAETGTDGGLNQTKSRIKFETAHNKNQIKHANNPDWPSRIHEPRCLARRGEPTARR